VAIGYAGGIAVLKSVLIFVCGFLTALAFVGFCVLNGLPGERTNDERTSYIPTPAPTLSSLPEPERVTDGQRVCAAKITYVDPSIPDRCVVWEY
jgi:hypothetical protein